MSTNPTVRYAQVTRVMLLMVEGRDEVTACQLVGIKPATFKTWSKKPEGIAIVQKFVNEAAVSSAAKAAAIFPRAIEALADVATGAKDATDGQIKAIELLQKIIGAASCAGNSGQPQSPYSLLPAPKKENEPGDDDEIVTAEFVPNFVAEQITP